MAEGLGWARKLAEGLEAAPVFVVVWFESRLVHRVVVLEDISPASRLYQCILTLTFRSWNGSLKLMSHLAEIYTLGGVLGVRGACYVPEELCFVSSETCLFLGCRAWCCIYLKHSETSLVPAEPETYLVSSEMCLVSLKTYLVSGGPSLMPYGFEALKAVLGTWKAIFHFFGDVSGFFKDVSGFFEDVPGFWGAELGAV